MLEEDPVLSYDSVKRSLLVGVITTGIVGLILLVGITVGITVPFSAVAIVSITLGISTLILSLFNHIQPLYRDFFQDLTSEDEQNNSLLFSMFTSARRRRVLTYLAERDERINVRDLADQIAAAENETTVKNLTEEQRKRLYVAMYQSHLPKMATASYVEYDSNNGSVELTDQGYDAVEDLNFFDKQFSHRLRIDSEQERSHFFHALKHSQRRYVLHYLNMTDQSVVEFIDVVDQVATWKYDCEVSELSANQRKSVYNSLHQTHLKILEDAELIKWDTNLMNVEMKERGVITCKYLSLKENTEDFPLNDGFD